MSMAGWTSLSIDWFWPPIFRTNLVRGPWNKCIRRCNFITREQFWHKLLPYLLVNPAIKISLLTGTFRSPVYWLPCALTSLSNKPCPLTSAEEPCLFRRRQRALSIDEKSPVYWVTGPCLWREIPMWCTSRRRVLHHLCFPPFEIRWLHYMGFSPCEIGKKHHMGFRPCQRGMMHDMGCFPCEIRMMHHSDFTFHVQWHGIESHRHSVSNGPTVLPCQMISNRMPSSFRHRRCHFMSFAVQSTHRPSVSNEHGIECHCHSVTESRCHSMSFGVQWAHSHCVSNRHSITRRMTISRQLERLLNNIGLFFRI